MCLIRLQQYCRPFCMVSPQRFAFIHHTPNRKCQMIWKWAKFTIDHPRRRNYSFRKHRVSSNHHRPFLINSSNFLAVFPSIYTFMEFNHVSVVENWLQLDSSSPREPERTTFKHLSLNIFRTISNRIKTK